MFTISVCMIVKNEEENLCKILNCAKKFADEIIIVDTGSKDKTKEIAQTFTDKVYDFEWCDDFSKARNYSFSHATCDYQMWLDADDFITDINIKKLNDLKHSNLNADVFMCKYIFENLTYFRERILSRKKNFKWEGFVHEAIPPQGEVKYLDIEIQHQKTKTTEPKRNLRIYQNALKKGIKFNAREQYYYSRELYYNEKFNKAINTFKNYLQRPDKFSPDHLGALILLSDCQSKIGQIDDAISTLFEALKIFLPTSELCCKIAYLFEIKNETAKAIFWFKTALQAEKQTFGFVQQDYETLIPCVELSRLLYSVNFNEAKHYHLRAKALYPDNPSVLFNEQFFDKT